MLGFSWEASHGILEAPSKKNNTSTVRWTSPSCLPEGTVVIVTVTNGGSRSAAKAFTLSVNPCPSPAVSAGGLYSLALRGDGTVWAWGANNSGELGDGITTQRLTPVQVPGLTGVTALAAGRDYMLALRGDGTVWGWGANGDGQLGDGKSRAVPVPVKTLLAD